MKLQNDTLLRALLRQPTEYTPVWLMRQAGRYMAEYTATRKRAGSFLGLAKSPADGYTILVHSNAHVVAPSLVARMPYDAIGDFAPVAFMRVISFSMRCS